MAYYSVIETAEKNIMKKQFNGTVKVKVEAGMKARINPETFEGRIHKGREFVIAGLPRNLCGTEVVALDNPDASRFSAGYDISMLEITDVNAK